MDEEQVSADEARQVPWHKRNKEQRRAIFDEREAKRKGQLKSRLDHIDQKHEQSVARIDVRAQEQQMQRPPAPQSQVDRSLNRSARLLEISLWLELLPFILGALVFVIVLVVVLLLVL